MKRTRHSTEQIIEKLRQVTHGMTRRRNAGVGWHGIWHGIRSIRCPNKVSYSVHERQ